MTSLFPITIPFANVNDESAILVEWLVEDGAAIEAGAFVATIETSKAAVDIESPVRGFVRHLASIGQDVPVGAVLGYITDERNTLLPLSGHGSMVSSASTSEVKPPVRCPTNGAALQSENVRPPRFTPLARRIADAHGVSSHFTGQERVTTQQVLASLSLPTNDDRNDGEDGLEENSPGDWTATRISSSARDLLAMHQLSIEDFGGRGMVRKQDVLAFLNPGANETGERTNGHSSPAPNNSKPEATVDRASRPAQCGAVRQEPVSSRKQSEIRNLAAGMASTLSNTVVVACATQGLRAAISQAYAIQGSVSAVIIYETSRLLRRYPVFNGYYKNSQAQLYEQINIGFAVDAGKGLKVLVIHEADGKSMTQISKELQDLLADYLNDTLPVHCLTGATFTISDLSGEGVYAFTPLISSGQAAIMGIGSEFFTPGNSYGHFNLMLTFDHQMAEGKQAALFLNELKSRLGAYETALDGGSIAVPSVHVSKPAQETEVCCIRCLSTAEYLERMSAYLIPTIDAAGSMRLLCTVCLQGC